MEKLRGKNRIKEFKKIADTVTSKVVSYEGVAGVIFTGGLTRGFADKYSDIDMIVLLGKKDENLGRRLRRIASDEQKRSGIDIDLESHYLKDFRAREWDEAFKWDMSHARIAFDPKGETRRLLSNKLKVSRLFWFKRIVIYSEYLKWYCCPPEEGIGTMVDAWAERGDLASAHYCLSYALDLVIRILFALNKEFLPAPKWRLFYSYNLKWLPTDYRELVNEAVTIKRLSKQDLKRRMKAIGKIWQDTHPKIKHETGLTQALISKLYVERICHQIPAR